MRKTYDWAEELKKKKSEYDSHRPGWHDDIRQVEGRLEELREVMAEIAETYAEIAEEEEKEDGDIAALLERLAELKESAREIYSGSSLSLEYYKGKKISPMLKTLEGMKEALEKEREKVKPFLDKISEAKKEVESSKKSRTPIKCKRNWTS